jgi:hypothetical protein
VKTVILISLICFGSVVYGQGTTSAKREKMFVIPSEVLLPTVASQPDCPLKFENVKLLHSTNPTGTADGFALRNTGTKPIRDYTIASYTSYGGMWSKSRPTRDLGKAILPGELAPLSEDEDEDVEIVPLTEEMRDKFKLRNREMGGVAVFIVVRVEFADGMVFSDEKAAKTLEAYFHKFAGCQDK